MTRGLGITINPKIGVGDTVQFSSVPENYFLSTGEMLIDESRCWIFDHNPYIDRTNTAKETIELWNFGHHNKWRFKCPRTEGPQVYTSNAEIWANALGVKNPKLNRPKLYQYERFPFQDRKTILLHVDGKSHGNMPDHIIDHVIKKYKPTGQLFQIGRGFDIGLPRIQTETLWDLAKVVAESRMLIGMDSGPSWIAACYPDVVVKKIRTRQCEEELQNWVPLEVRNIHSHWDDRCHQVFNQTDFDVGFTSSYRRI